MSVGQAIRDLLKNSNISNSDLANQMGLPREKTITESLSRGKVDKKMITALSILTKRDESEINKIIEEARKEENDKATSSSRIKELEEKIKHFTYTIEKLEEKILEKTTHYEQVISAKEKIIADQEKIINHKEKIIEKNEKLLEKILSNTKKL